MILASIVFAGLAWGWVALFGAAILLPLAWMALRPGGRVDPVALTLRVAGVALLLLCLLDPQWVEAVPKKGANLFVVLADNSQSLQISDNGADASRGQQVHDALTGDGSRWLSNIGEEFQIRDYVFDRDLRRVSDFGDLDFQGDRSSLLTALRQIRERFNGQPLAGVLLFTDGDATDLASGMADLTSPLLPPIYPVVVGKAQGLKDLSIDHTEVRQTAFDDAPVSVTADIVGQNIGPRELTVSVRPLNGPVTTATTTPATGTTAPTPGGTVATGTPTPGGTAAAGVPEPQQVALGPDQRAEVKFDWRPIGSGVQFYEVSVEPDGGPALQEATQANNHRIVMADRGRQTYRILYVAGRPNWDFKFINRALADDPQLDTIGLIRIAKREPKFEFIGHAGETGNPLFMGFGQADDTQRYDQPILERVLGPNDKPSDLASGFPDSAEALYAYDAIIIEKVEASFFTPDQLLLLRRYVLERGGGLLMIGGAESFANGGYEGTAAASAIPVYLDRKVTPPQGNLTWQLTREGWLEPWTRVRSVETDEQGREDAMPTFDVLNPLLGIKPGATVFASVKDEGGKVYPALVAEQYGAGRVAALAVGDMWKWAMSGEQEHTDYDHFWRQLARWLVTEVPARVELHAEPAPEEGGGVNLLVTARDKEYHPLDLAEAKVTIRRVDAPVAAANVTATPAQAMPGAATAAPAPAPAPAPDQASFKQVTLTAEPVMDKPGKYAVSFNPRDPGAYLADVEVTDHAGKLIGHAQAGWVNDPAAEEFRNLAPNQAVLEDLARRTGGRMVDFAQLDKLADQLKQAPAPLTEAASTPLWHQSWVLLAMLGCFITEWAWRRWKGLP